MKKKKMKKEQKDDKVDEVAVGQIQLHSSDHGTEDVFLSHLIYQKKYQEEEKEKS